MGFIADDVDEIMGYALRRKRQRRLRGNVTLVKTKGVDSVDDPQLHYAEALLMSFLAGAATSLGGLVVCCLNPQRGVPAGLLAATLALAAGVMLAVSMLELVAPATARGEWQAGAFFACGCLVYWLLSTLAKCVEQLQGGGAAKTREKRNRRLGILMTLALTAHNLPEGLAVAVTAATSRRSGLIVTIAIAMHNIPEGLAIAVPLYAAAYRSTALVATVASGFSEPAGALLGILLLRHLRLSNQAVEYIEATVAGVMTCIAVIELLPEAHAQQRHTHALVGFIVGWALISLTIWLIDSRPPIDYLDTRN